MIQAQPYKSPSFYVGQMRVTIICDNSLSPIQLYLFIAYNVYEIWHHLLCGKYIMLQLFFYESHFNPKKGQIGCLGIIEHQHLNLIKTYINNKRF